MATVNKPSKIMQILIEEYGISTQEELNKAFAKLEVIDISPFCCEIKKRRQSYEENCQ